MQVENDPFYFSRSDLSDEVKMAILDRELKESLEDIKAGRTYPLNEVIDELIAKYSVMIKVAS